MSLLTSPARPALLALLALPLAGCGQKGPLTLPAPPGPAKAAASPAATTAVAGPTNPSRAGSAPGR